MKSPGRWSAGTCLAAAVLLAGTGCDASPRLPDPEPWVVDTSGWWVPADPQACLEETDKCRLAGFPTRSFVQGVGIFNAVGHGEQIDLFCSAPAPADIRNSIGTPSTSWFYAEVAGERLWLNDVTLTPTDTEALVDLVPDCPSNTPGILG